MKAVVSEKGQVTIPKPLRDSMGIGAGDVLEFREDRGRLVATKAVDDDPIDSLFGILDLDRSTDEIMVQLRGEPDAV